MIRKQSLHRKKYFTSLAQSEVIQKESAKQRKKKIVKDKESSTLVDEKLEGLKYWFLRI